MLGVVGWEAEGKSWRVVGHSSGWGVWGESEEEREAISSSASVLLLSSGSEESASEEDILKAEGERGFNGCVTLCACVDFRGCVEGAGIEIMEALDMSRDHLSASGAVGAVYSL